MGIISKTIVIFTVFCDFCGNSVYEDSESEVRAKSLAKFNGFVFKNQQWYCDKCHRRNKLKK